MADDLAATVKELKKEVEFLKKEIRTLKDAAKVSKKVATSVDGPRRSEVFVDAQVIPMTGQFKRKGDREIELDPPTIDVDVVLKGQIGTSTTFTIEINDVKKEEKFVTTKEKEIKPFTYSFADFKLGG